MTGAQRQQINGWFGQTKDIVQLVGGLILIAGAIFGCVMWFTGGLKPQTQVAADDLTRTVNSIQTDVGEIKATLKILPSPFEVTDQRAHFGRLDDHVGKLEVGQSALDARVTALEHQPHRNPQ